MHNETDTQVLERDSSDTHNRNRPRIHVSPLWIVAPVFIALAIVAVAVFGKAHRGKIAGVMEAVYSARSLTKEVLEPVAVKTPRFNHVVFRLGDREIFRFIYEDGGDDLRYSFEVKEGGA